VSRGKRPCASSSDEARRCGRPDLDSGSRLPAPNPPACRTTTFADFGITSLCFARDGDLSDPWWRAGHHAPPFAGAVVQQLHTVAGPIPRRGEVGDPLDGARPRRPRESVERANRCRLGDPSEEHEPAPARASSRNAPRERARDPQAR
jgi:hypothetical protein